MALINPNTRTCPIFRSKRDADITKAIYERVPVLLREEPPEQNPWDVKFSTMFHMSNDSGVFRTRERLKKEGWILQGNVYKKGSDRYLPLYEAKMVHQFTHRYGDFAMRPEGSQDTELPRIPEECLADSSHVVQPRYWVPQEEVLARRTDVTSTWFILFRGLGRSSDERTLIFSFIPLAGVGNSAPILGLGAKGSLRASCLLANANSIPFDYVARQKCGGANLNFFIIKQLPIFPPNTYDPSSVGFLVPLVLELVYTAWDIKDFANDIWRESEPSLRESLRSQWADNQAATAGRGISPPECIEDANDGIPFAPFTWNHDRRARLRAQLDAYYAHVYGLTRDELRYILDPKDVFGADFPSETFRVLKEKEEKLYGEYRTRRLVLEAFDKLADSPRFQDEMPKRISALKIR
jgi:hypothetical protein